MATRIDLALELRAAQVQRQADAYRAAAAELLRQATALDLELIAQRQDAEEVRAHQRAADEELVRDWRVRR